MTQLPPPPPRNSSASVIEHPNRNEMLKMGGGGPYDPSMEQRVANLEHRIERVEDKLDSLNERVAEMSGKVSMLPGYPGIAVIMTIVGGGLLVVARLFPSIPTP